MKRRTSILILLFLLFIPFNVEAKEYCKIISGNNFEIGSEIACGSEHFYVLSSSENEVRMLAKYNLNTGVTIYKEPYIRTDGDTRTKEEYCKNVAESNEGVYKNDPFYNDPNACFYYKINRKVEKYDVTIKVEDSVLRDKSREEVCNDYIGDRDWTLDTVTSQHIGSFYNVNCTYNVVLNQDYTLLQSENAKSAHWDEELNYLYPQVGDVYMTHPGDTVTNIMTYEEGVVPNSTPIREGTNFYDFTISLDHLNNDTADDAINNGVVSGVTKPLYTYKYLLEKMGFEVNDISLLPLSELDELINKFDNSKRLPLQDWQYNYSIIKSSRSFSYYALEIMLGDLKPFIPKKYSWLYSTTYWNSSVLNADEDAFYKTFFIFTAEQGKLCGAGFEVCAPETTLGCGIRPVVTIPKNIVKYSIKSETDNNGTIEVVDSSFGGENITFKITAKEGYRLKKIEIKTDSGEILEFTEEEVNKNEDGTVSISSNKFTMPYENVTIYVVWGSAKETKPITVDEPAEDVKVEDTIKVPDTFYSETLLIILIIVSLLFISIKITKKTS